MSRIILNLWYNSNSSLVKFDNFKESYVVLLNIFFHLELIMSREMYDENGNIIYDERGFPKTKKSSRLKREFRQGNVVLAYTTSEHLILDCDLKREDEVKKFQEEYARFHDLGSSLSVKTSDSTQLEIPL